MKKLNYHLVDVFTNKQFAGNQLAVVTDGRGLSTELMQKIAREFNFSETTFVLPPKDEHTDFWVRIFTPSEELPMAGHPTIGTAFILAKENMFKITGDDTTVKFEEGVGLIPVTLEFENGVPKMITMQQPLPTFGPQFTDRDAIAKMLSIESSEIDADLPITVVSCGLPFLYVPIKNLQTIKSIEFRTDVCQAIFKDFATNLVYCFTMEPETSEGTVHSRMFEPMMGIGEDPATGSACGPLGSYLVKNGVVKSEQKTHLVSEQGFEIGRPSIIHIDIEHDNQRITRVKVGGECAYIGSGHIELP